MYAVYMVRCGICVFVCAHVFWLFLLFLPQPLHFSVFNQSRSTFMSSTCKPSILWISHKFSILQCQKTKAIFMHGWKLNEFYVHMRWCRQPTAWDSDANSITEMQISHFCLSKYLYKFVFSFQTMMYVCVCVSVKCVWISIRAILKFRSVGRFCVATSFQLLLVRPSLFCILCINYIRGTSGKLWFFNYCTSIVCE